MRLKPGDRLRCSNPECRLQVMLTDLGYGKEIQNLLRCACGFPMKKFYEKPTVSTSKLTREASAAAGVRGPR